MAKYHGRSGSLFLASANGGSAISVVNLTQFSLSQETDTADVTALGDTARSFVLGVKNSTATFSGFFADDADVPFDAFDQNQSGGTVPAYLYPGGSGVARYWHGEVWPTAVSIEDGVGGAVTISGSLQFNGSCTRVG